MPMIEKVCPISIRGQITVPKAVRQALGVGYGGRLAFRVEGNIVTVHALPEEDAYEPTVAPFLRLLAIDLAARRTDAVRPFARPLIARLKALAEEMDEVDPDAPIEDKLAL